MFRHSKNKYLQTVIVSHGMVHLYVCVLVNSKNNGSINMKLENINIYENSSDEFDIGHSLIKVMFLHLSQYKLSSLISQLWHKVGSYT